MKVLGHAIIKITVAFQDEPLWCFKRQKNIKKLEGPFLLAQFF